MKNKNYFKLGAIIALLIASFCAVFSIQNDRQLCLYHYSGHSPKIYFAQMNGFTADEPILFALAGLLGIVLSLVLFMCNRRQSFFIVSLIFFMILLIIMQMFYSAKFWQIMLDSISYCHNKLLMLWGIGLISFCLCSVLFFISDQSD